MGTQDAEGKDAARPEQPLVDTESPGMNVLMSGAAEGKRDPLTVPLVGLLLAFSVISLIVQLLIAFS